MIWYSERKRICDVYDDWRKKNGVVDTVESFCAFIAAQGWLNEDAVRRDLRKEKVKED